MPDPDRCRHFGTCGGCSLQDLPDEDYEATKRRRVAAALNRHEVAAPIDEIFRVPPRSRRRATFKARKTDSTVALGFHVAASHRIADMHECLVLTPRLFALTGGLRRMLAENLDGGGTAELQVTDTDTGFDVSIRWSKRITPSTIASLSSWACALGIARIVANSEIVVSLAKPTVQFGEVDVRLPPQTFLQPSKEGEEALRSIVAGAVQRAKHAADLFAGCGTLTFGLAQHCRVHAVDNDRPMLAALDDAARRAQNLKPVSVACRDLFKRPLSVRELAPFDLVVLDPPRAGALEQARQLAHSVVRRIAYVSCNPETFARDAKQLVEGGYFLSTVAPVDQFLWSDHIELVGLFERGSA